MSVPPNKIARMLQQQSPQIGQSPMQQGMGQQAIPGGIGLGQSPRIGLGRPQSTSQEQPAMPRDPRSFDWNEGAQNTPEAVANMRQSMADMQKNSTSMGMQYKVPDVISSALKRYESDPAYNTPDMADKAANGWTQQQYQDRGYTLQDNPDAAKTGGDKQQWTAPSQPVAANVTGQPALPQAGMPTTLPAQGQNPKAASGATMPSTQQPPNPKAASGAQLANAMQPPRP